MSITDTPRTDACPHCGLPEDEDSISSVNLYLCGSSFFSNGARSTTLLCSERSARQKAEAEVERLTKKLTITEDELADAREWLDERYKATSEADERAEKAEARVDHYADLINKADDKVLELEAEIERLNQHIKTQNLIAREEAKILQRWKEFGFKQEEKAKELEANLRAAIEIATEIQGCHDCRPDLLPELELLKPKKE